MYRSPSYLDDVGANFQMFFREEPQGTRGMSMIDVVCQRLKLD